MTLLRPMDLWRCAIVRQDQASILRDGIDPGRTIWLPDEPHGRFLADPFGLWRDGALHVFAEAFDYRERIGRIERLRYDSAFRLQERRIVLQKPWHLSYPMVFEAEGEVWMLPEAFASGTLTLYRARQFPDDWEPVCDIALDGAAIDATPWFRDGMWWLFYTPSRLKSARRSHLHLAFAPALTGPWRTHPGNPVLVDQGGARPGGSVFLRDGHPVLPVQDCRLTYGRAIRALEITRLDPHGFAARHAEQLEAADWMVPRTDGLHTLSAAGPVSLIDAKWMDASLRGKLSRLDGVIRQKLARRR
ncbi:formyl transferase [Acetobacteraceae bacterium KSS8]|uniref:Formyl transferase n=1 Tax=Endosaccharibacter trunci TaxID=2812733 RepID=A0ABT1W6U8_9PROT|nr:formyl transferase [Acetobacteraceae bacterium KSS8]